MDDAAIEALVAQRVQEELARLAQQAPAPGTTPPAEPPHAPTQLVSWKDIECGARSSKTIRIAGLGSVACKEIEAVIPAQVLAESSKSKHTGAEDHWSIVFRGVRFNLKISTSAARKMYGQTGKFAPVHAPTTALAGSQGATFTSQIDLSSALAVATQALTTTNKASSENLGQLVAEGATLQEQIAQATSVKNNLGEQLKRMKTLQENKAKQLRPENAGFRAHDNDDATETGEAATRGEEWCQRVEAPSASSQRQPDQQLRHEWKQAIRANQGRP
jgi:hypothetical protein